MWLPLMYFGCAGHIVSSYISSTSCEHGAEDTVRASYIAPAGTKVPGSLAPGGCHTRPDRSCGQLPEPPTHICPAGLYLVPVVAAGPCCGVGSVLHSWCARALQPPARCGWSPILARFLQTKHSTQDVSLALPGSWGNPAAETASLSCRQPEAPRAASMQPPMGAWSIPAALRGGPGVRQLTAPTRGKGASLSLPHRWMPTGTESNVCSTTTPYRQPLTVFARTLRPLGGWALAPAGTRYAPAARAHSAGSAHTGSGAAGTSPLSQSTSRPCGQCPVMEASDSTEETPLPLALTRFQLSEDYGFLLPDPLVGDGCATASACYRRQRTEK